MVIQNTFIFIISIFTILLGLVIYKKNYKNPSNFWYFCMCVFGGMWGIMKVIQFSVLDVYWHDLLISRFVMIFGTLSPLAYFLLAYHFVYKDKNLSKSVIRLMVLISTVISFLYLLGVLKHAYVSIVGGVLHRDIVLFDFSIFSIYFFIYVFVGLNILFKKYIVADGVYKDQIRYLMIGTTLTFLTTGIVSVVLLLFNNFKYDWLGPIFLSIHLLIIGYFVFIKPRIAY